MKAGGKHRNRPPVGVVGRVRNELIIKRNGRLLGDPYGIVGLENLLIGVVQPPVADQQSDASGSEEILVNSRKSVDGSRHADGIIWPLPGGPFQHQAAGNALIDVGERQDFIFAVVPAYAGECAEILAERLLCVGVKPFFSRTCCRPLMIAALMSAPALLAATASA